jgi:hypothetical protein
MGAIEPSRTESMNVIRRTNESIDVSVPLEDFMTRIVADALTSVLDDRTDTSLHPLAHQALARTLVECPRSHTSHLLFRRYITRLLDIFRVASEEEREHYFPYLIKLLELPSESLNEFAEVLFDLVISLWDIKNRTTLVQLISILSCSLNEAPSPFLPKIISMLLDCLEQNVSTDTDLATRILVSLTELSISAYNLVFIILRNITEIITETGVNPECVICALQSLQSLVRRYDCSAYTSFIFRCCLSVLDIPKYQDLAICVLFALRERIGSGFDRHLEVLK